jgi:hypothetical protein
LENIEKGETNSFAEFINHFQDQSFEFIFADLNEENQNQFRKIFVPQLNSHVQTLITNHSQMNKEQFIEKVKKIFPFKAYLTEELNQQLTNLLKTDLETKITNPPVTNNKSV